MSEESIVMLSILGMILIAICFVVYVGMNSDLKQKEILKEVVQEVIKYEQSKESQDD